MIRAIAELQNTDAVEMTVTLTMPVGEWKKIVAALDAEDSYWPVGKTAELIKSVLRKMLGQVSEVVRTD